MIEIKHLKKEYENVTPLSDISLTINDGDVVSIIGPSGTGKSTLLRMINMLEKPTSGQIIIDGKDVTADNYPLEQLRQKVGMVFQQFNLFNHMTVIENVCYAPIVLKHIAPKEAYENGMKLLNAVGLSQFALSYPNQLSGGQKQRAAVARTLAMQAEIILFDEPTSALDPTMTGETEALIKHLSGLGQTMVIVTHDMNLAKNVSNRIVFICDGTVYDEGSPEEIFDHPQKEKTRNFTQLLKDFNCEINSSSYDFMSLYTRLEQFIYKNHISANDSGKIKAIFEELCFQILVPQLKDQGGTIRLKLSYSEESSNSFINADWDGIQIDYFNDEYSIQRNIINHYAKDVKCTGNRIEINA